MKTYRAGIDIGSTTVKLVLLDEQDNLIFGEYQRHHANTQKTLAQLLRRAQEKLGQLLLKVKITGSGSINLGKAMEIGFADVRIGYIGPVVGACIGPDAVGIWSFGKEIELGA